MPIFALAISSQTKRLKIPKFAGVAKLVDVPDLGSGVARRVGSSPITRTKLRLKQLVDQEFRSFLFFVFTLKIPSFLGSRTKVPHKYLNLLFFLTQLSPIQNLDSISIQNLIKNNHYSTL